MVKPLRRKSPLKNKPRINHSSKRQTVKKHSSKRQTVKKHNSRQRRKDGMNPVKIEMPTIENGSYRWYYLRGENVDEKINALLKDPKFDKDAFKQFAIENPTTSIVSLFDTYKVMKAEEEEAEKEFVDIDHNTIEDSKFAVGKMVTLKNLNDAVFKIISTNPRDRTVGLQFICPEIQIDKIMLIDYKYGDDKMSPVPCDFFPREIYFRE